MHYLMGVLNFAQFLPLHDPLPVRAQQDAQPGLRVRWRQVCFRTSVSLPSE